MFRVVLRTVLSFSRPVNKRPDGYHRLTLNQLVVGSSPTRGTSFSASVAELVDAADSKLHFGVSSGFIMCRFIEVF